MATEEDNQLLEEEADGRRRLIEQQLEHIRTGEHLLDIQMKDLLNRTKEGRAIKKATTAAGEFAGGLKESATAVAGSGGQFTDLSKAVSGSINAISELAGAIPLVGAAVKGAGKVLAEASAFAFEQVQAGFSGFQELSQIGQIGSDGITGLVDDFRSAGIPLETYTKMLQENSENLAFFSASALDGGATFAKTMKDMAGETGMPLRRLGFTIEEIGETVVDFQKMQAQLGFRQTLTQDALQKKSMAYGKELDIIAKLTGKQREEIQKEREAAMSDARFRAKVAELTAAGREEEAIALTDFINTLKSQSPEMARAAMDLSTGVANTEAARKAITSGMSDTLQSQMDAISAGQISAGDALNNTASMAKQMSEVGGYMHQAAKVFESGTAPFINFAELMSVAGFATKDMEDLRKQQKELATAEGSQTDQLVRANRSLQDTAAGMNALFLKTGIATAAIGTFANILNKTVTKIEQVILGNGTTSQNKTMQVSEAVNPMHESGVWFGKELREFAKNVGLTGGKSEKLYEKLVTESTKQTDNSTELVKDNKAVRESSERTVETIEMVVPPTPKPRANAQAAQLSALEKQHEETKKEKEQLAGVARGGHAEWAKTRAEHMKDSVISPEEKSQGRAMLIQLQAIEQRLKELNTTSRQQQKQIKELKQITKNSL